MTNSVVKSDNRSLGACAGKLSWTLSIAVLLATTFTTCADARGFGGGGRGGGWGGGWGGGGFDGSGRAFDNGLGGFGNDTYRAVGNPLGMEDSAEWHYEHPSDYRDYSMNGRGGGGAGGFGAGGEGRGAAPPARPQVSEADRVAAANQSYKWGFDRSTQSSTTGGGGAGASHDNMDSVARWNPSDMVDRAGMVRDNFNNWNAFRDRDWWNRYPNAWWVNGWGYGGYGWGWGTWDDMCGLMGLAGASADYYDYGDTITYNNNNVYYGSNSVGTQEQYYDQAQTLASSGSSAKPTDAQGWKPLGVYALSSGDSSNSNMMFQLAIDKAGDIGGNYYNELTQQVLPVQGKVDKKNQRASWIVGGNKSVVYDTGLGNLLATQAPILVHFSKSKTQQMLLVRMQQPSTQTAQTQTP